MKMKRLLPLYLLIVFVHSPAMAEQFTGLEIEELYAEFGQLYTQAHPDMDKIQEKTRKHSTEDYSFHYMIKSDRNNEIIEGTWSLEDLLYDMKNPERETKNTSLKYTLQDIRYSNDQKEAQVNYTSILSGDVTVPGKNFGMNANKVVMQFKSLFICEDSLKMEEGIAKRYKEDCKIETIHSTPEPVE